MSADEVSATGSGDMTMCPYCAELIKVAAVKCRYCQSDLMGPPVESTRTPSTEDAVAAVTEDHATAPVSRRRRVQNGFDSVLLFAGVVMAAALAIVFGVVIVSSMNDGPGSSCSELEDWYDENPGDSNVAIAKDYFDTCGDLPPPVINGELDVKDIM